MPFDDLDHVQESILSCESEQSCNLFNRPVSSTASLPRDSCRQFQQQSFSPSFHFTMSSTEQFLTNSRAYNLLKIQFSAEVPSHLSCQKLIFSPFSSTHQIFCRGLSATRELAEGKSSKGFYGEDLRSAAVAGDTKMTTRIAPGVGANLLGQHSAERNQDATAYVGNLDPQVTEELLWELFVQAGPVVNVYVPKDRVTNLHQGYGFVEFRSEEDADYAIKVLNMIKLYGKPIRVNKASQDKKSLDVGANLFIGNLDPDVDEKLLYDTFSAFGVIVTNPKIMRDPETGNSRGFGFVSYDSFEASDAAIEAMNGQYLCNRQITVSYAYKKDTKGERHGTLAERVLAASNPNVQKSRPHTLFASGPPTLPNSAQANGAMGAPMPRPFSNGVVPPPSITAVRPHPPQQAFPPMPMPGQVVWHGQPPNHGQAVPQQVMPPPQMQFRQPPPNMPPPPPPHHMMMRPPPQQMGMGGGQPNVWNQPPPPPPQHQQMHGRPLMQQMSMPPPPPPPS